MGSCTLATCRTKPQNLDLQTLFEGAGHVSTINIVQNRATGQARGFAFVK